MKKFNLYKLLQNIAVIGIFLVAGIGVLGLTQVISLSKTVVELLIIIGILCVACLLCLPWVRKLEKNDLKIVSYVFLGVISVCAILCIIAICLLFGIGDGSSDAYLSRTLNFTKICAVILIQLSTSTLIASSVIKYQKSFLAFQTISYVAHLYVDFYISFFLCCINLDIEMKLSISDSVNFLGKKAVYVIAILMLVYVIISRFVMKSIEKRHTKEIVEDKIIEENKESKQ